MRVGAPGVAALRNRTTVTALIGSIVLAFAVPVRFAAAAQVPCLLGEVKLFAGSSMPLDWISADGRVLSIAQHSRLNQILGARFGGDGVTTFAVPNLANSAPLEHTNYLICSDEDPFKLVNTNYLGEVALYAGEEPPPSWEFAEGQIHNIDRDPALFAIVGTLFGGDGITTLAVPNLTSRGPISGVNYMIAERGKWPAASLESYLGETTILPGELFHASSMEIARGQILPVNSNILLFAVIQGFFGGNGLTDFALPDLTAATPAPHLNYLITYRGVLPFDRRP
jgi:microcystin-dependent protein